MNNNRKKKVFYWCLLGTILIVIILLSVQLFNKYTDDQKTKNAIENVLKIKEEIIAEDNSLNVEELRKIYNNEDIVGILKIDGTTILDPIVKTINNTYYLNHTVNKEYSIAGALFVDYRTALDSKQMNIYGHNSAKFKAPFRQLKKYLKEDFYKENKYIEIYTENDILTYEIFSVEIAVNVYEHEKISFNNNDEWNRHFNILKNNSIYPIDVDITGEDNILVLQTCLDNNNSLLVISSRKV